MSGPDCDRWGAETHRRSGEWGRLSAMAIESPAAHAALDQLRSICSRLPEVNERLSHHTPTFFVRDKKVLVHLWENHHNRDGVDLWCPAEPGVQAEMVDLEPDRFFVPPYVGHRGWLGVRIDDDTDWDEIMAILTAAYRQVAPKTLVRRLDDG